MEETPPTSTEKRIAVVTGGNKGIGLEICRQLASNDVVVILTARNETFGKEAVEKLKASGISNVLFHQLDVTIPTSVARLAEFVKTNFNKLDILVNNAAEIGLIIHADKFRAFKDGAGFMEVNDQNAKLLTGILEQSYELGERCLKTNYYGTKSVTEALLSLLQLSSSPRIVNLSSFYGELKWINNENVKSELRDVETLTEERIDEIIQWFLVDLKTDKLLDNGWPLILSAYIVSKVSINAYTRIMAKQFPNILVNCVHPGYVVTDITTNMGHLTPEEGARAPVMVALLSDNGPSGVYFKQMEVSPF